MRAHFRVRALVLCAIAAIAILPACSSVRVTAAEDLDLSSYRTWGWGTPIEPVASESITPRQIELAHRLTQQIRLAMSQRGFQYAGPDADLLVTPELRIRQRRSVIFHSLPNQYLPSHHDTPSYQFEGMTTEDIEVVEVTDLVVAVVDRRRDQVVWRGRFLASFQDSFAPHLETSVAALMDPFPSLVRDPFPAPGRSAVAVSTSEPQVESP